MTAEHAPLTPAVLRWARERAGYTVEEVAARLKVKPARVASWEAGTAPVTIRRLDALAALYRRPTALFYLAEPPSEEEHAPTDFRAKPSERTAPGLRYQIRYAEERRSVALDLLQELAEDVPRFPFACARTEEPGTVGDRLRAMLGVPIEAQLEWRRDTGGYSALAGWKEAVERLGVLVFQASRKDLGEVRGLSIHADRLPVALLRSADVPVARVFTLMHELVHLGLRQGGVCDLHDANVELYCNQVAAAVLMPRAELLRRVGGVSATPKSWPDEKLRELARVFSVSEPALVLRLVEVGAATWELYQAKRRDFELRARAAESREDREASGFVPPHTKSLATHGRTYARLVLEAHHRGVIPAARAMRYLGVSFEAMGKIELDLGQRASRAA